MMRKGARRLFAENHAKQRHWSMTRFVLIASCSSQLEWIMPVTVLIVDDSKLARFVVAKALSTLQPEWHKIEASGPTEALQLLETEHADIALIDFNMADKDGLELASELRVSRPDMPIAILTANIQDEIISRARQIGAAFIAKPITAEGLEGFLSGAALRLRAKRG
jgi:CheY-like chemotaxis protein